MKRSDANCRGTGPTTAHRRRHRSSPLVAVVGILLFSVCDHTPQEALYFRRVQTVLRVPSQVSFIFSLRDAEGHAVNMDTNEMATAARIWEDNTEIDYTETNFFIHAAENLRLDAALAMDFTNSMNVWTDGQRNAIDVMVQGASNLIDQVAASHRVALIEHHDRNYEPSLITDFLSDKTALHAALDSFVNSGFDNGSTRCWDAVYKAIDLFPSSADPDNVRVVIFLSDGFDTSSGRHPSDCISLAQAKDVQLYVIACGSVHNEDTLKLMASSTDGLYYAASDLPALQQHLAQIITDLGGQYKASYTTLKRSGTYDVKLHIDHEGLFAEHTEHLDLGSIFGDDRIGSIVFDESEIANQRASVFVRAEHVPRNIGRFRFKVETDHTWTPSALPSGQGGICPSWSFSEPDSEGYISFAAGDTIAFGNFGVLWKMDFEGITESGVAIPFTLDNSIYTNDKSFTYPNQILLGLTPPDSVETPQGPTECRELVDYHFSTRAVHSDRLLLQYQFLWGYGDTSAWTDAVPSGTRDTVWHQWPSGGMYFVRARARSSNGAMTAWTRHLPVLVGTNQAPGAPDAPSGPSSAYVAETYWFAATANDPEQDSIRCRFTWGNGDTSNWLSWRASGEASSDWHVWHTAGSHGVQVQAQDVRGATSAWSEPYWVQVRENTAPAAPGRPSGPDSGSAGVTYHYSASATDPDGDSISYQFAWGPGDTSGWVGWYPSGATCQTQHAWDTAGIYEVRVRAGDPNGHNSDWSEPCSVLITPNAAPEEPPAPAGPDSLQRGQVGTFEASTTDPEGDSIAYQFDWGAGDTSGWLGWYASGAACQAEHVWDSGGTAAVRVRAGDRRGNISSWSAPRVVYILNNRAPLQPMAPEGPESLLAADTGHFMCVTSDPDGDSLRYIVDWGDGTRTDSGWWRSGETASVAHLWPQPGVYSLRVMALDLHGDSSDWSSQRSLAVLVYRVVATVTTGSRPRALTWNSNDDRIYSTDFTQSTITAIECSNNSAATIGPAARPYDVCYNSYNNKVYWSNESTAKVTIVNGSSHAQIGAVSTGASPRPLCYVPFPINKVYCASYATSQITVINGATNSIVRWVDVGADPRALCQNSQAGKLYCANNGGNSVTIIDVTSDSVITTTSTGVYPRALCYNPRDNKIYCANYGSSSVSVIDGASNSVIATVVTGSTPIALCYDPKDNKVYCANSGGDNVSVIDGTSSQVVRTILGLDQPAALWYDASVNKVLCANYSSAAVSVIDWHQATPYQRLEVGTNPFVLLGNPNRRTTYCANFGSSSVSVIGLTASP